MQPARGTRNHHKLLQLAATPAPAEASSKKGRSADLNMQRNRQLFYRYYYYAKLLPFRPSYDYILCQLGTEMHLSQRTVLDVLTRHGTEVQTVFAESLSSRQLSSRYPHLNWRAE